MTTWQKKYDRINPDRQYTAGQAITRWVGEDNNEYSRGAVETVEDKLDRLIEVVAYMVDTLPKDHQRAIIGNVVIGFKEST